jgi:porin
MTVAQTFPRFVGPLARILRLGCATILCAITPSLFAAEEDSIVAESDQIAGNISQVSDSALPAADRDSFHERLNPTDDWVASKDRWLGRGVTLDTNPTQFFQGVASGGKEQVFKYGGKLDYYLNIDGDKAGLRDGFLVSIHAETRYGEDINPDTGMLTFANFNMAFPKAGENATGVTKFIVSQSLSDECVVFAGKINTLDDFELNFTRHNGIDRFMNSGIVANIVNARTVPYSTYGTGSSVNSDEAPGFSFVVRDPNNHATTCDLDDLFADGVLLSGTVKIPVTPFGLPGNRNFGVNWNSRKFTLVDPSSFIIVPGQGLVGKYLVPGRCGTTSINTYGSANQTQPWAGECSG